MAGLCDPAFAETQIAHEVRNQVCKPARALSGLTTTSSTARTNSSRPTAAKSASPLVHFPDSQPPAARPEPAGLDRWPLTPDQRDAEINDIKELMDLLRDSIVTVLRRVHLLEQESRLNQDRIIELSRRQHSRIEELALTVDHLRMELNTMQLSSGHAPTPLPNNTGQ